MTASTRSGRILRSEGTSSTGNAAAKAEKPKDSPTSCTTATRSKNQASNSKGARRLTTSGSAAADSSNFRKFPPNKETTESSSGSRKTERLENQASSTPSDKKAGKVEKKRPHSPVRRSARIEKNGISTSPGSKKLNWSSSPPSKKKKSDDKSGKVAVTSTESQSKDKKVEIKIFGGSEKKKSLAAHRYRALLTHGKDEFSNGDDGMHLKDDIASKGSSFNSASTNSKKLESLDESNARKEDQCLRVYFAGNSKEAVDGSSSGVWQFSELTVGTVGRRKSARLSGKKKFKKSPVTKGRDNSSQLSVVGSTTKDDGVCVTQTEIHGVDVTHSAHECGAEEFKAAGLVASMSDGKSLAVDKSQECGDNVKSSKNAMSAADLDCDVSVAAGNKKGCHTDHSKTVVTSSSPCESSSKDIRRCIMCHKLERAHDVSEAHDLCLCNAQREHDLIPSLIEEPYGTVSCPCESEAPAVCSQYKGYPMPEASEHSPMSQKQNCIATLPNKENVSIPMNADRGAFGVSNGRHPSEEPQRVAPQEKPLVQLQRDQGTNTCVICKHPGQLLCCDGKGCKSMYHLSCLSPPLQDIPPGAWLCHVCVKKKVELGVYSVSEGIESIWDVKEEMQNGKHYFVKYKGLAHVHNQWISESQILSEAPMLVAKFDKKYQKEKATRWRKEWTEPQRLLRKRSLVPKNLVDEHLCNYLKKNSNCYNEWLVKWHGLNYEHATWELESSPFLSSLNARALIGDFECRHEEAKRRSDSWRADKALLDKRSPFHNLTSLPSDCPAGIDDDHLNFVNRLCEFWHKSRNAVFIDQERIIKSILFVSALKSHTCQPFLVISMVNSLSLWESEFMRLAPSMNVVVYAGSRDVRQLIHSLEFYDEGGRVMFQVLLSLPDTIIEDFKELKCIAWEAVIIDDCQNPRVLRHLNVFRNLSTEFRLLPLSCQLKVSVAEYLNILSFLESRGKEIDASSPKYDANDTDSDLAMLKEKLRHYLAYEQKMITSKFLEYWVPVRLSNVQVEQYCSTLVSNSITLRSFSKVDQVGAVRDILVSTRKCCDHPYLVGGSLQSSLIKDLPLDKYLEIGVKVSGKLYLLDKFLNEIKNQGLRVLILFQSDAGRDSIGDILDDFLRQRFGEDSYERVGSGLITSKKLVALSKFNDKTNGRFVFLIESRACLPSIKLSSVDAVVIFNSDWNPLNDLRALQKMHIESQLEHIKVFRLYSMCTVEEKALIFAKQNIILDSNVQNISTSNSHFLLSWGAVHLFKELDEFHEHVNANDYSENSIDKCFLNEFMLKFLNDVMAELVKQLPGKAGNNSIQCLLLIKAQYSGASYPREISLIGERDGIASMDNDPPNFWSNLLGNRHPKWRFITESSQRIRRKVQHFQLSVKEPGVENDEVRKKRRKISLQSWLHDKRTAMSKDAKSVDDISPCISGQSASISKTILPTFSSNIIEEPAATINHETHMQPTSSICDDAVELRKFPMGEYERMRNAQRMLNLCLKPELSELCDTLKLAEDVKALAHKLLEYTMNNHHVNEESETILQAFKLSLCWRAASFSKQKVDHRECLALAKKYLNYRCNEEEAFSVYSKLRMLKKMFSQPGALRHEDEPNPLEHQPSASKNEGAIQQIHVVTSESAESHLLEPGKTQNIESSIDVQFRKRLEHIDIVCSEREVALCQKQKTELFDYGIHRQEEKTMFKTAHDDALEFIRSISSECTIRNDKIRLINQNFSKKMTEYDQHMESQRRKLVRMQEDARNKERDLRVRWVQEARAGTLPDNFDLLPSTATGFRLEEFRKVGEHVEAHEIVTRDPGVSTGITDSQIEIPTTNSNGSDDNAQTIEASAEILENAVPNMAEVELIEPNETSAEIPATVLPVEDGGITEESGTPLSESDVMNALGNRLDTMHIVPSVETTSLPQDTVTLPIPCSNMVELEPVEPNTETILPPEVGGSLREITTSALGTAQTEPTACQTNPSNSTPLDNGQPRTPWPLRSEGELIQQPNISAEVQAQLIQQPNISAAQSTQLDYQVPGRRLQILPMAVCVHPQALHPDPLQNELMRIRKQVEFHTKTHEDKKRQLKLECEQEMERVRKKYDALVQDDEVVFHQDKKVLETIYNKVLVNQMIAEGFRTKFIEKGAASASFQDHSMQQLPQTLPAPRVSSTTSSTEVPVLANQPPVSTLARASTTLPLSASQLSASFSVVTPSANCTNHGRSQFTPIIGTDMWAPASRSMAPHLQRFRTTTYIRAPPLPPQLHSNFTTATATLRAPLSRSYQQVVVPGQLPLSHGFGHTVLNSSELMAPTIVTTTRSVTCASDVVDLSDNDAE